MLPYVTIPPLRFGSWLTLQPFGTLVVIGCLVGYLVGRWHIKQVGLDPQAFRRLTLWVLGAAFLGSYWAALLCYYPEHAAPTLVRPWRLLAVDATMSSYGGFFGAVMGALLYWRRTSLPRWEYADALVLAWAVGWFFGRLSCTLVHDHPGLSSTFFLAVQFPDGPRHDLGLYECLCTIGLNVLVWSRRGKALPPGALVGMVSMCYAPMRFLLDFLRVDEPHYVGLTPGQHFSVALLLVGLWVWRGHASPRVCRHTPRQAAAPRGSRGGRGRTAPAGGRRPPRHPRIAHRLSPQTGVPDQCR